MSPPLYVTEDRCKALHNATTWALALLAVLHTALLVATLSALALVASLAADVRTVQTQIVGLQKDVDAVANELAKLQESLCAPRNSARAAN